MRTSIVGLGLSLSVLACGRGPLDLPPAPATGSGGRTGTAGASGVGGTTGAAGMSGAAGFPGTGGTSGAAGAPLRVPAMHRPTADRCPLVEETSAPSPCLTIGTGPCKSDSDCTDGKDGRCVLSLPFASCGCTYDACFADGDCPGGGACVCSGSYSGNTCVTGNCHVDADCGFGGFCSPVIAACSSAVIGYQCHTQKDKCVIDADCGVAQTCAFFPIGWGCSPGASCPASTK